MHDILSFHSMVFWWFGSKPDSSSKMKMYIFVGMKKSKEKALNIGAMRCPEPHLHKECCLAWIVTIA